MQFPTELLLVLGFALFAGVLATRFRQPAIIGLLIIGAIVGPYNLGIIKNTSMLEVVTEVGAVILLFMVGIEFNISKLLKFGPRAIIIGALKLGGVAILGYFTSLLFGLDMITSLFIGTILSITSTVIFLKVIEQKGMAQRKEIPLLVAILIIEDLFGIFALTFFSSLNEQTDLVPIRIAAKLMISLVILLISYLVLQRVLKPAISWMSKYSSEETTTFLSLGLCGLMVFIAVKLRLSPTVGAFLAGNIVSQLPNSKEFEKAMHPFLLTFTSLFFFSIGAVVSFSAILANINLIVVLFIVLVIGVFLTMGLGTYVFGNFSGKGAVFSALSMATIGEFSLLLAKEGKELGLSTDLVSITAGIILISAISMIFFITKQENAYKFFKSSMPRKTRNHARSMVAYLNSVFFKMTVKNKKFEEIKARTKRILWYSTMIVVSISTVLVYWIFYREQMLEILKPGVLGWIIPIMVLLIVFVSIFFPALGIIEQGWKLTKELFVFFWTPSSNELSRDKKIFRAFLIFITLFSVLVLFPIIGLIFNFPFYYNIIALAILGGGVIYIARAGKLISVVTTTHKKEFDKVQKEYSKIKESVSDKE